MLKWKKCLFIRGLWQYKKHSVKRHQENHIGESGEDELRSSVMMISETETREQLQINYTFMGALVSDHVGTEVKPSSYLYFVVLFLHSGAEIR